MLAVILAAADSMLHIKEATEQQAEEQAQHTSISETAVWRLGDQLTMNVPL